MSLCVGVRKDMRYTVGAEGSARTIKHNKQHDRHSASLAACRDVF